MKRRTGKECKKVTCANYKYYSNWSNHLSGGMLSRCMECRNAHVSQFVKEAK
jgi:hypothetical protein